MIDTVRKNRRSSAIPRDEYPRDRTAALAKGGGERTEQALLDTLRRTELQIQAIGQISLAEEIISGDVEGLARKITELAAGVVGCERVNVWLFDANETVLRCIDLYEATSARHSAGMLLREHEYRNEFYALKNLKCVDADDPLTDPRTAGYVETYLKPLRITSMLDAVIKLSGTSLGILCFEHVDKPHHWEQDEISFASQLADKLALALMSRMRIRAEVELRASEARFRALVEQAPEAILVYDVDRGHVIDANRQAEALFACCRDELLKSGPQRFYVSEQPDGHVVSESFADHNRRALAGESVVFERRIHNANEEDLVCEVRLARLPSGESDGRLLRASFIDTTQRKHAEEKLRLANTLLASEIESAPDGVLVVETGRGLTSLNRSGVASFNRKCLEMWKIPPDVARRRDPDAFLTTILEQIADPEDFRAEVLRFRDDPDMPIHRDLRLKDGRTFECHTGALRQAPGDSVGRISFFRDITDRKRAEAHLRESEERFRTIFASVNDAIMVNDADTGTILNVNQRMCEMFGYTREKLLELDVADLSAGVAPYTLRDAAPVLKRAAAGEAVVFEWFCRAKNGRRFWIEISLRRAAFGGRDVLLSTARDVTERRRAAEALTYRDRILHAMTLSAAAVVAGPSLALSMPRALKIAGEALQVDRMLVLERLPSPIAAAPVSLSCGWQKAGVPHLEPGYLVQFPAASKEVVEWLAPLSEGKPVITYGDTATGAVGQIMREMKNRSNLLVPISVAGEWWGHIGIDDCKAVRHWTSVEIDTLGTLAEVIGAVITRERTQASLQKSEERFRAVSETAQDAVIMLDEAGTVLYWNRSAQRILGHTVDEAIGRSVQE